MALVPAEADADAERQCLKLKVGIVQISSCRGENPRQDKTRQVEEEATKGP